jgi:hypothetical protein
VTSNLIINKLIYLLILVLSYGVVEVHRHFEAAREIDAALDDLKAVIRM